MPDIVLIGLNHKTASVELRECIAFSKDDSAIALQTLHRKPYINEIILFSTCNRVEVLLVTTNTSEAIAETKKFIADSNELSVNRHFYPELKPAFDISPPEPLAWAFPHSEDDSLFNAASTFFEKIREDGTLERLIDRYYGHIGKFDYVGTRRYLAHIEQRLPQYKDLFIEAANEIGMDWRLLAAVGYQESHWDPDAVSPTGVRGIMMLTKAAAKDLGIKDRDDPEQSIRGGAHYMARMLQRIPERVPEPDRTWLALAAYNVGHGHLEDARILTQKNKGNFDRWLDVKESLPLLSKKKWFQQTRYGYARGREPVRYVDNIRTYYDILVWLTDKDAEDQETVQEPPQFDVPAL